MSQRICRAVRSARRLCARVLALLVVAAVVVSCGWRGIGNVPMPAGALSGGETMTVYVQVPDTLGLNVNSQVRVADVLVGTVRAVELKNWIATLTLTVDSTVRLPQNATAKIGQTSVLGSRHVELASPATPSPRALHNGDTIPLASSSAYPSTERTLAGIGMVLRGGGIPNLEVIQNEVYGILDGNAEQIRGFLDKLNTFTRRLDEQRQDLTRAIDSTNDLLRVIADRDETLNRVLAEIPPLVEHFAAQRDLFGDAVIALGRFSKVTDETLLDARSDLDQDLRLLQRPLEEFGRAAPYLVQSLRLLLTAPFIIDNVPKIVRGDYMNISPTIDLTQSTLDNAVLTGTGLSGALRALEQSWGRDPATMIPDVRFTPNPNSVPGGPLVERGP